MQVDKSCGAIFTVNWRRECISPHLCLTFMPRSYLISSARLTWRGGEIWKSSNYHLQTHVQLKTFKHYSCGTDSRWRIQDSLIVGKDSNITNLMQRFLTLCKWISGHLVSAPLSFHFVNPFFNPSMFAQKNPSDEMSPRISCYFWICFLQQFSCSSFILGTFLWNISFPFCCCVSTDWWTYLLVIWHGTCQPFSPI